MFDPKYTQTQINQQLKALSPKLPIHVTWDGDEAWIAAEGEARFWVFAYGDDTPFTVHDIGYSFDLIERNDDGRYSLLAGGRSFTDIAKAIIYSVEDAIADGTIHIEEEEEG